MSQSAEYTAALFGFIGSRAPISKWLNPDEMDRDMATARQSRVDAFKQAHDNRRKALQVSPKITLQQKIAISRRPNRSFSLADHTSTC